MFRNEITRWITQHFIFEIVLVNYIDDKVLIKLFFDDVFDTFLGPCLESILLDDVCGQSRYFGNILNRKEYATLLRHWTTANNSWNMLSINWTSSRE